MFLVKCGKKFYELTNTNVYTLCPDCNEVHQVDIVGLLSDGLNDLENTVVYCEGRPDLHGMEDYARTSNGY